MYIAGKDVRLVRVIAQTRFADGYAYSGLRGQVVNQIRDTRPGWIVERLDEGETKLRHVVSGLQLTFSASFVSLTRDVAIEGKADIDSTQIATFVVTADELFEEVMAGIGASEVTRTGTRGLYAVKTQSISETEAWLTRLNLFAVSKAFSSGIHGTQESLALTAVFKLADRRLRIAAQGAQGGRRYVGKNIQLNIQPSSDAMREEDLELFEAEGGKVVESHFALLDLDASTDDGAVDVGKFVESSFGSVFHAALEVIAKTSSAS